MAKFSTLLNNSKRLTKLCKRCRERPAISRGPGKGTHEPRYAYRHDHDLCGQCHRSVMDWKRSLALMPIDVPTFVDDEPMGDKVLAWLGTSFEPGEIDYSALFRRTI